MHEFVLSWQSAPWLVIGAAFIVLSIVLRALKIAKQLTMLVVGVLLLAFGVYCGVIDVPVTAWLRTAFF